MRQTKLNGKDKIMALLVSREKSLALFKALGYKTANKWDNARLQKKLVELSKEGTTEEPTLDDAMAGVFERVLDAKGDVVLKDSKDEAKGTEAKPKSDKKPEADQPKKKKKKVTAGKSAAEVKPKAEKKKKDAAMDKFGSRVGSQAAKINSCLTKKAKTMAELMGEVGAESTFYNHLNKLVKAGHVAKTDDGYKIA